MRRLLVASISASVIIYSRAIAPAEAIEPVTMAVVGVASTALQLSMKRHDVTGAATLEILGSMREVHQRLDKVEEAIGFIMKQTVHLPEQMRSAVSDGFDAEGMRQVFGATDTVSGLIKELQTAKQSRRSELPERYQELREQVLHIRNLRNTAFRRNDFAVTSIVPALVVESLALSQLPTFAREIPVELKKYDERISQMLDDARPGSLANIRSVLEKLQADLDVKISQSIVPSSTKALDSGDFIWFAHTLMREQEFVERYTCKEIKQQFNYLPPGFVREVVQNEPLVWKVAECIRKAKRQIEVHSTLRTRRFYRSLYKETPGIFTLELKRNDPQRVARSPASIAHLEADEAFEKPYVDENNSNNLLLKNTISTFNSMSAAIFSLRELEQLASSARVLIASSNSVDATALKEAAESIGAKPQDVILKIDQSSREAEVARIEGEMAEGARRANEQLKTAYGRIERLASQARKEKWKSDLLTGIELFKVAYSVQAAFAAKSSTTTDASINKTKSEGDSRGRQTSKDEPNRKNKNTSESKQGDRSERPSETTNPPNAGGPVRVPKDLQNPDVTRVEAILREVDKKPAKAWDKLPPNSVKEEMLLLEGFARLQRVPPSDADDSAERHVIGDIAKAIAIGGLKGGKKEILKQAVIPASVSGGTGNDHLHQVFLHRQLTERYRAFVIKRVFSDDQKELPLTPNVCATQACWKRSD